MPTAIRMLMNEGDEPAARRDLSGLRHMFSVGETLGLEPVNWASRVLGVPLRDTWWQTETGAIMCASHPGLELCPGSIGKPVPGVELAVVDREYRRAPVGVEGHLAAPPGWPAMFARYLGQADMYNTRFRRGWYVSGDTARMDEDGYFWLTGRSDDQR